MTRADGPKGFETAHLPGISRLVADTIVTWATEEEGRAPYSGGCRAFYSPTEWARRGELPLGPTTLLVIVHDGGALSAATGLLSSLVDPTGERAERLDTRLRALGCYLESITGWYSAVLLSTERHGRPLREVTPA